MPGPTPGAGISLEKKQEEKEKEEEEGLKKAPHPATPALGVRWVELEADTRPSEGKSFRICSWVRRAKSTVCSREKAKGGRGI